MNTNVPPPTSLKNVKVSTIKPYTKTEHPAVVTPSFFDLQVLDAFVPIIFFYKLEKGRPQDGASSLLVERMKESLSKVLVPYFPMAGRWVRTYDGRIRELECNDEGVPFIEASIDEDLESVVKLKDYLPVDLLGGNKFVGLDGKAFHQAADNLPALFVQVTQFKCGSVALHVAICHNTMDGEAIVAFMNAWSEIAFHGETSIVPVHDRSLTYSLADFMRSASSGTTEKNVTNEEEDVTSTKENGAAVDHGSENLTRADPGDALKLPQELVVPTVGKTLHVRRQVIEDLKREAAQKNMRLSTVDLITAHIWRSLNNFPESMDGKTSATVGTWVDGRKRFHSPPLPDRYSGNAIINQHTPLTAASELASNSPLFAANIVHDTVRAVNSSNWSRIVGGIMQTLKDFPNLKHRLLMISSWFSFPIYEVNFSREFGKPILVAWNLCEGLELLPYGVAIINPVTPVMSKEAIATVQFGITTKNDAPAALFSDQQFLSFFL